MVNLGEDDGSVILTGAKNLGLHRAERLYMNDKVKRRFAPTKNQKPAYVTLSLSKHTIENKSSIPLNVNRVL